MLVVLRNKPIFLYRCASQVNFHVLECFSQKFILFAEITEQTAMWFSGSVHDAFDVQIHDSFEQARTDIALLITIAAITIEISLQFFAFQSVMKRRNIHFETLPSRCA
ncbi:CLUMA_CG008574, isoform A [Clunio marinus]|uniref:CLUMA_CG008574, isoform A n=1 Tax=Clunio marinus TaxID=568069 RepID=A0A1J1I463_9DIPT|nr:CLUMA_CG008574, isoform A [Clunio marinus]